MTGCFATTSLLVEAALRWANRSLVSVVLVRRGAAETGAILVRLDHPDGTASLEARVLDLNIKGGDIKGGDIKGGDEKGGDAVYRWQEIVAPPVSAEALEARLAREIAFDPDCWILAVDSAVGSNPLRRLDQAL